MNTRLKQIRKALRLTQADFGELMGLTPTAISKIESGKRGVSNQLLELLNYKLNVNVDWVTTGKGEMFLSSKEQIQTMINNISKNEKEKELLNKITQLNDENYYFLCNFLDKLIQTQ